MLAEERCQCAIERGYTYDPITGNVRGSNGEIIRRKITTKKIKKKTYLYIRLKHKGKTYKILQHRFAWYFMYGYLPDCIDHKNGEGMDNRLENIRSVSQSQNSINRMGVKGYKYSQKKKRYVSSITVEGVTKHLGYYSNEEDAVEAYMRARDEALSEIPQQMLP